MLYICLKYIDMSKNLSEKKKNIIESIKKKYAQMPSPKKIVFYAKNLVVVLKSEQQLKTWIERYPNGRYTINNI